jgi:hypothetical protein
MAYFLNTNLEFIEKKLGSGEMLDVRVEVDKNSILEWHSVWHWSLYHLSSFELRDPGGQTLVIENNHKEDDLAVFKKSLVGFRLGYSSRRRISDFVADMAFVHYTDDRAAKQLGHDGPYTNQLLVQISGVWGVSPYIYMCITFEFDKERWMPLSLKDKK